MEIKANLNYLRMSPRKTRLVAGLIKGMRIKRAEEHLARSTRRSARPLLKLLRSAAANARQNFQLPDGELYVKDVRVDEGPALKRFRPRAFGRSASIRRRASHVSLVLETGAPVPRLERARVEPVVRDAGGREDFREKETRRQKPEAEERPPAPVKSKGFMQRMFRRKAI